MNLYSISQLERFSGIKAHTIRMWEQRYDALQPVRSKGNTRYYDNLQLKRLLNIVSLMNSEHKVSELCFMTDSVLTNLLSERLKNITIADEATEYSISQLIAAGLNYDEVHFEKIFANCVLRFGMEITYTKVIYPMLLRIGLMWSIDAMPLAQEHFISNMVRQKLFSSIDALPPANSTKDAWLLFLPENEFHEIGLLFSHYVIRLAGKKVIYLGSNIPVNTIQATIKETSPANILLFLVHNEIPALAQRQIAILLKAPGKHRIYLSGNEHLICQLKTGKEIQWLKSVKDLEHVLTKK
ncbi:MAG: MerR family transcriptional regulator [Chitinophagaceae bacterium]|nr:MerR family transcriptional regulator [Chitinophagaceae bacterium]